MFTRPRFALPLALVLCCLLPAAAAAPLYTVLDLGKGVEGTDLNERGQVVGNLNVAGLHRAFITGSNGSGMTLLPTLGGPLSKASGVNAHGQVVGYSYLTDDIRDGPYHAFLTGPDGAGITDLGTLGGPLSYASDVNDRGEVVGMSDISNYRRSFVTGPQGVGMSLFAAGGELSTYVGRINGAGQIAGEYNDDGDYFSFITGANAQGVTTLAPGQSLRQDTVLGINEAGMVSGGKFTTSPARFAFITGRDGSDLRTIWHTDSEAHDINNLGLAVGEYHLYPEEVASRAFVYGLVDGTVIDLNTLVDLPGVVLNEAVAINDRGQILANSGNGRAYLLTPVPEPAAWALLACGLALVLRQVGRQRAAGGHRAGMVH